MTSHRPTTQGVAVVVPVFGNRGTIRPLFDRLVRALGGADLQVVFVDDASPDGSFEVVRALAAEDPRVVGVRLARNVGQHRAVLEGLAWARGARVVVMDADLQDPPEGIPALLESLDRGADVAFAGRRGAYESAARLRSSRRFKRLLAVLGGLPRDAGMFVAFDRAVHERLLRDTPDGKALLPSLAMSGAAVTSIPVERAPRPSGTSAYSGLDRAITAGSIALWAIARRLGRRGPAPTAEVSEAVGTAAVRRPPASAAQPLRAALVWGGLLAAVGLALTVAEGYSDGDEAWFLYVLHRVNRGEVLYRDVFFGSTPLSVHVGTLATRALGEEVLVLKALVAACFTATALLTITGVRSLGARMGWALVAALIVYARPHANSLYNPLATVGLAATFAFAARWTASAVGLSRRRALLAGVAIGLTAAAKPTVGALAGLAFAAVMMPWRAPGRRATAVRRLSLAAAVSVSVTAVALLPTALSGGLPRFLEYGFTAKNTYLAEAGVGYLDALRSGLRPESLARAYSWTIFLVPLVALVVVWLARRGRPEDRRRMWIAAAFGLAAFASAYPRFTRGHLAVAAPLLLAPIATAWPRVRRGPVLRAVALLMAVWVGIGAAFLLVRPVVRGASDGWRMSTLPHMAGALVPVDTERLDAVRASALEDAADRDGEVFVIAVFAGLAYLTSGAENPTPFDYPVETAFGRRGQEDVIAALRAGRIRAVCLGTEDAWVAASGLRPERLVAYVEATLPAERLLPGCVLRRRGP